MSKPRITIAQLEALVARINKHAGKPLQAWGPDGANIGNYHLSGAYGGYCLHQVYNKNGGIVCPLVSYHEPKRALYERLQAFLTGLEGV